MIVENGPLNGLKVITLQKFEDARGFFVERFNSQRLAPHGLPKDFAQDNFSRSHFNVLRGLHAQFSPAQSKLVSCLRGSILDVAVDIRKNSPSFGQHFQIELSDDNLKALWIPAGFAHGFCVTSAEGADVLYKVDETWNPKGEICIRWDDPDLKIKWPTKTPIVSYKDRQGLSFVEFKKQSIF